MEINELTGSNWKTNPVLQTKIEADKNNILFASVIYWFSLSLWVLYINVTWTVILKILNMKHSLSLIFFFSRNRFIWKKINFRTFKKKILIIAKNSTWHPFIDDDTCKEECDNNFKYRNNSKVFNFFFPHAFFISCCYVSPSNLFSHSFFPFDISAEFPSKLKQQDNVVIFCKFLLVPYVDDEIPLSPYLFSCFTVPFFVWYMKYSNVETAIKMYLIA